MKKWQASTLVVFISCASLRAQVNSAEIQAHYQRAREAVAHHDLQRASQEYAEILKLDPRNAEVYAAVLNSFLEATLLRQELTKPAPSSCPEKVWWMIRP